MTKQDWDALQEEYESKVFVSISLKVGDFNVQLQKQIGKNKVFNVCYVNGYMKGEWLVREYTGPEKQFMYSKSRTIRTHSDKELRSLKRRFGADYAKKFEPVQFQSLRPFYPSFNAFKRQMIATGLPITYISE